ncbi:MAG: hypothetical protein AAGC55_34445, partial [Myxococcota bacterium]
MNVAAQFLGAGVGIALYGAAIAVLFFGYFYIFWDKRNDESKNKDDGQVGLKLVLYALILVALAIAVGGLQGILGWLLSGAKGGSGPIKAGLAHIVAGGAGIAGIMFLFLPRTNAKDYPQAERFALGAVAALAGISTIVSLDALLSSLLGGGNWSSGGAAATASLLVSGGLMMLSLTRFGAMSGWTAPARPAAPMGAGFPQSGYSPQGQMPQQAGQQAGYQQQAGYGGQMQQPQQGGYQQPQQGGYQ